MLILSNSIQHLPLHPVLQLPPSDHGNDNFQYRPLRILLLYKIIDNALLGHLCPYRETPLQLPFNPTKHLVFLFCRKPFGPLEQNPN